MFVGLVTNVGNFQKYGSRYFSGIYFKKHFRKNCLRASFDLYRKTINEERDYYHGYFTQNYGQTLSGNFRFGYEREFSTKRLIPYLGADLVYIYSESKGYLNDWNDRTSYGYNNRKYLIKENEYAVSMGAGVKLKLSKNFQVSYELSGQFGRVNSTTFTPDHESTYGGNVLRFNPVRQLGLGILF